MDSTGGAPLATKGGDQTKSLLSTDKYKFLPSINEQGLSDKSQKKKLETMF